MKRLLFAFFFLVFFLFSFKSLAHAIEDPLLFSNNKIGVHILFTTELEKAAWLINSNGGDWGYVTIPIQVGDKDIEKWQKFMDDARDFHVIPIIRLATEGNYFDTKVWKKPSKEDVVDFANFLNSLDWPIKNRYVVVFNEVNRGDEWEGELNPQEYAEILSFSVSTFKNLDQDFFIISSGLDNAAPNEGDKYMNQYDYMVEMNKSVPGIFNLIDGLGSHSYPNPGFKQMPYLLTKQNVGSFSFERKLAYSLSGKNLPVFITETGWSKKSVNEEKIAECLKYAFDNVWSDKNVVAVTLFLLQASTEPFSQFSLLSPDGERTTIAKLLQELPKIKGEPLVNTNTRFTPYISNENLPTKTFPKKTQYDVMSMDKTNAVEGFFKWFLRLYI